MTPTDLFGLADLRRAAKRFDELAPKNSHDVDAPVFYGWRRGWGWCMELGTREGQPLSMLKIDPPLVFWVGGWEEEP